MTLIPPTKPNSHTCSISPRSSYRHSIDFNIVLFQVAFYCAHADTDIQNNAKESITGFGIETRLKQQPAILEQYQCL